MIKNANWTVAFILLASSSYAAGIGFRPIFKYSPIFGYFLGLIFVNAALYCAIKRYRK